ncbi:unnamed protein product [Trichobilharzia szidati]|nr:unnamed protein product [Trichobilharzia szidati]
MLSAVDLHTDLRVVKACLAFPILALISSSVPPVVETMLPRSVDEGGCFFQVPSIYADCCLLLLLLLVVLPRNLHHLCFLYVHLKSYL